MEFLCSGRSGQLSDGARMREWRERGAAREGGGRPLRKAQKKKKKPIAPAKTFQCICTFLCVFCLTCTTHTKTHGQSAKPPTTTTTTTTTTTPPRCAAQNKTSFVSRAAECEPPPPHSRSPQKGSQDSGAD